MSIGVKYWAEEYHKMSKTTDLRDLQRRILENKKQHGFNTTDVETEFLLIYGEVAEAYEAWRKKKDDLGEEFADVAIYLLGLAEILGIDLGAEIDNKVSKNAKRVYQNVNGVTTRISEGDDSKDPKK
jgi:NTP pyrophosphatase (non-canonical NTP hydrolase)